jgi:hypothetical protein
VTAPLLSGAQRRRARACAGVSAYAPSSTPTEREVSRSAGICDTWEAVGRSRATLAPFRLEGSLQVRSSSPRRASAGQDIQRTNPTRVPGAILLLEARPRSPSRAPPSLGLGRLLLISQAPRPVLERIMSSRRCWRQRSRQPPPRSRATARRKTQQRRAAESLADGLAADHCSTAWHGLPAGAKRSRLGGAPDREQASTFAACLACAARPRRERDPEHASTEPSER